jgi:serine/threonine protein kinase
MVSQQSYDEAIRLPRQRLLIPDADIVEGAVEMVTINAGTYTYQRPWGQNGGYAVVYRYRTQSGERKALRCYRVAMRPEIKERYEHLERYIRLHLESRSVGFRFFEEGIVVDERVNGAQRQVVHPVLLMDWIEGTTLLAKVDELCRMRNQEGLQHLYREWMALVEAMQQAHVAHGDLSGGNIMVCEGGHLVLVDYDGMFIPDFAGQAALISGVPDYQHPQSQGRPFNERMDEFSIAVISVALLGLQAKPHLWDTYAPRDSAGTLVEDRLLFSLQDFLDPDASALFGELADLPDPLLYAVITQLKEACRQKIEALLLPPPTQAFALGIRATSSRTEEEGLTARRKARILLAVKREQLRHAIRHGLIRESLRLARELDASASLTDQVLMDGVGEMRRRVLSQVDPQICWQIVERTGDVCIRWLWPEDSLIQYVVVAWRSERWPELPGEPGTYLYSPVAREEKALQGQLQFHVGQREHVYIQTYYAMVRPSVGERRPAWLYSRGTDPQSRCEVVLHERGAEKAPAL